jgi:AcrR family transcriptional regulator
MAVRKMVNRDSIEKAARNIIDRNGVEALSMRTLASAVRIKAPSLYAHVKNRDEVIALVQAQGLREFGEAFKTAGETTREKVLAYRDWALANPNLYPVVFQQKLLRELLPAGLEAEVLAEVVKAAGGSHVQARVLWAQLHGLVDLELQGRLPENADTVATWDQVILGIEQGLAR